MKKLLISLFLCSMIASCHYIGPRPCWGFSLFDGLYKKINDNSTKEYKLMDQVAGELGVIKGNQLGLINEVKEMKLEMNLKLSAIAQAQGNLQAGFNNRSNQSTENIGGNKTETNTNSTELLMYIFGGLFTFMTFICGRLVLTIRQMNKQLSQLIERNTKKEEKIFELVNQHTTSLLDMVKEELKEDNKKEGVKNK